MKFSVIVPFLNESAYIDRCLEALDAQDFPAEEQEWIFVDNGSTDGSRDAAACRSRVTLLSESRKDPYLARNRGIEAANGDYLVFLDADCAPHRDWLSQYSSAIGRHDADILIGNLYNPEPVGRKLRCYQDYYNIKTAFLIDHAMTDCYYGHAGNMAVRKTVFDEVGDTAILHDLMALRGDAKIIHVPDAGVVHLEVSTFDHCLEKLRRSGVYTRDYETNHGFRTLSIPEKLRIMHRCADEHGYSLRDRLALVFSLYAGWRAFEKGRRSDA